jgi:ParB family transcriptional regulator, chromosome partitioning protein
MNGPGFIQNIPLDKLVKSPRNVRKTPPSEGAEAELRASIAAHGLQQNLVVAPASGEGVHEVIAGGRRLAALKALQAEGKLPADCVVPCFIRTEDAAEISLAENMVR